MADTITKNEAKEMMEIITGIREKAEKFGTESAEFKRYSENAEARLKALDEKAEELNKAAAADRKAAEDLREQVKDLEARAALMTAGGGQSSNLDAKDVNMFVGAWLGKSFSEYVQAHEQKAAAIISGMRDMNLKHVDGNVKKMVDMLEAKSANDILRSDIGELGGFLCPPEYAGAIEKTMIEYSPFRTFVRVRRTASKKYIQQVRVGIPKATRAGETRSGNRSIPKYAEVDFSPQRMQNTSIVTVDELQSNAYNVAADLVSDNSEAFAVTEGQEFFNGSGVAASESLGFTVDPNVPEFSTATNALSFDDMINVTGQLKQGYRPMYAFNRRTLAYLRTLKDDNGRYLWSGPFGDSASGAGATINGLPYSAAFIEFDDYDVANGYPVLFADMLRFYQMVDRTDITIIRDEYTLAEEAKVKYIMNRWTYGAPMIKEAGIRVKKIA